MPCSRARESTVGAALALLESAVCLASAPLMKRMPRLEQDNRTANRVLLGLASMYFLVEWLPSFVGTYGYFIDELYYIACSQRLDFGYVDHPPLSIVVLRLLRSILGDSLPALRLFPALCGGALILITGLIARRLGAGTLGQAIAAGAAMVSSIPQVFFSFYSMNAISLLLWALCFWILVEIERSGEPRLWLAFGLVAGLGLQNKHTLVLLAVGLALGLLLTSARQHLGHRWIWIGLGIATLLLLPNLIWQVRHDWMSLEFYRNADLYKNLPTPSLEVLKQQVLFMNPATLPIWLAGLVFLLATKRGRPYRHLGWLFLVLLVLMLVGQKSRPDRITAAYTILFAGGGVLLENWTNQSVGRWLRICLPVTLVLGGVLLAPIGMPLLPPQATAAYAGRLGLVPQLESGEGKKSELPQWLADRFGWEQLVDDVERVAETLRPEERASAIILAPSYGQAGAIELFGRGRALPPVFSGHNSYYLWGPPEEPVEAAVIVGFSQETAEALFETVEPSAIHACEWCMPWRDEMPIWIGRGPRVSLGDVWAELRHFE